LCTSTRTAPSGSTKNLTGSDLYRGKEADVTHPRFVNAKLNRCAQALR
jgi:hypothetical protein